MVTETADPARTTWNVFVTRYSCHTIIVTGHGETVWLEERTREGSFYLDLHRVKLDREGWLEMDRIRNGTSESYREAHPKMSFVDYLGEGKQWTYDLDLSADISADGITDEHILDICRKYLLGGDNLSVDITHHDTTTDDDEDDIESSIREWISGHGHDA